MNIFIEVFRPVIDNFLYKNKERISRSFDTSIKAELVLLLNEKISFNKGNIQISNAIEQYIIWLKNEINGKHKEIVFPKLKE